MRNFSEEEFERAIASQMSQADRQEVDECHVEQSEEAWLTSSGLSKLSLDEQTRRFKAKQVYEAFVANDRNIAHTAIALKIAFNTVKTHVRYYMKLSKD
jgi:hypothetical protein